LTQTARGRGLLGLGLFLPTFLIGFDAAAASLAGPGSELAGSRLLVLCAYLVAGVVSIPVWRALASDLGHRRGFIAAVLVFLAGSALCGAAQSTAQLVASRVLLGIGAGGVLPLALVIIGGAFPQPGRTRATSLLSTAWGVSTLGGPTLGGLLAAHLSWRLLFLVNLPVGVVSVLLVARRLHEPAADRRPQPPTATRSDVRLGPVRGFGACAATAGLAGVALFVVAFVEPASQGRPVLAGLALLGAWGSWAAASLAGGQVALLSGPRVPAVAGAGMAAAGSILHILPADGELWTFASWVLLCAGLGLVQVTGITLALAAAPAARVRAAAGQHLARSAAGTLAVAVALALAAAGVPSRDAPFLLSAAASAVALPVAARLRRPLSAQAATPPSETF
jgi:predicted MFS family arabinose efflux permease